MSDKFLTTGVRCLSNGQENEGPHTVVRHKSVTIPIYAGTVGGKVRFTIAFYLDGRRQRRMFTDLEKAKHEAKLAAEKIQRGLEANNDLSTRDREIFHAARKILTPLETPMLAAVEEYARARKLLGDLPLLTSVQSFLRQNEGVKLGMTVPQVYQEMLVAKKQDGLSKSYQVQLKAILGLFAAAFPGPILHVKSEQIDQWLRKTTNSPVTRNNRLRNIRVMFSFAKQRNYLSKSDTTQAELVLKVKVPAKDNEIFTPEQFNKLLHAAPARLIPLLAISGFSGLRAAELSRLDWSAVNINRRIIELRATQAKTAARRILPISDNLAAWLAPFVGTGSVISSMEIRGEATALAKKLGIGWPQNVLRHSYISYRVALTGDVPRTALEAGNSPDIIFRHYREVVDEDAAKAWFGIMPPAVWPPAEWRLRVRRKA